MVFYSQILLLKFHFNLLSFLKTVILFNQNLYCCVQLEILWNFQIIQNYSFRPQKNQIEPSIEYESSKRGILCTEPALILDYPLVTLKCKMKQTSYSVFYFSFLIQRWQNRTALKQINIKQKKYTTLFCQINQTL